LRFFVFEGIETHYVVKDWFGENALWQNALLSGHSTLEGTMDYIFSRAFLYSVENIES